VFHLCDRVICNSHAAAHRLIDQGLPERRIAVISNGLPDGAFASATPALPPRPGVLLVGMIARMNHPVKNHAAFLRAAARLAKRIPSLEFLLVGDGPMRPDLERMVERLGLAQRTKFLGERSDITSILASMDISVLPSTSESLSNAILESMAAGVPVIATRVGGNSELVRDGETGLLIPAESEDALVEAIERMATQRSLREECGRRARELARVNFTLDRMREEFEQLCKVLLAEKMNRSREKVPGPEATKILPRPLRVAIVAASPRWIGGQSVQAELLIRHWKDDPQVKAEYVPIDPPLPHWLGWVEAIPYFRTIIR
jgi:L-malate glycosyltransferase